MANVSIINGAGGKAGALVIHGLTDEEFKREERDLAGWGKLAKDLGYNGGLITTLTIDNALAAEGIGALVNAGDGIKSDVHAFLPDVNLSWAIADDDEDLAEDDLADAGWVYLLGAGGPYAFSDAEPAVLKLTPSQYEDVITDLGAELDAACADKDAMASEILDTLRLYGIDIQPQTNRDAI